jgi:hypothetical protein
MARLDRRTIGRLESRYPKVSPKDSAPEELEAYFQLVENYKAELSGDPPPHPDLPEEDYSDLDWYWEELAEQAAERDAARQRRRHDG